MTGAIDRDRATLLELHQGALDVFGRRVRATGADQLGDPTPCTEWSVRDLINHLVVEQLWVPPLLAGQSTADVGDRLDGDQLAAAGLDSGTSLAAIWYRAATGAHSAFSVAGALDGEVELSYGPSPAADYLAEMIADLVIHAWDLARALGTDEHLDPELVAIVDEVSAPQADRIAASGVFAEPVPVPDDADRQTTLLARFGRAA